MEEEAKDKKGNALNHLSLLFFFQDEYFLFERLLCHTRPPPLNPKVKSQGQDTQTNPQEEVVDVPLRTKRRYRKRKKTQEKENSSSPPGLVVAPPPLDLVPSLSVSSDAIDPPSSSSLGPLLSTSFMSEFAFNEQDEDGQGEQELKIDE